MTRFGPPDLVVADRWRAGELRDGLDLAGVPASAFSAREAMGWKDGAEDVRGFRRACIDGRVKASKSLLVRSALVRSGHDLGPCRATAKLAKSSEGGRRQASQGRCGGGLHPGHSSRGKVPCARIRAFNGAAGGWGCLRWQTSLYGDPGTAHVRQTASCGGPRGKPVSRGTGTGASNVGPLRGSRRTISSRSSVGALRTPWPI